MVLCYKLKMNNEKTCECKYYYDLIVSRKLIPECSVYSIPSAVIYFVAQSHNLNISKRDIREKGGVSEVTINKIYKKILLIKKGVVLIDN